MGCEIQFAEVARRSGVPLSEIEETEVGTISGNNAASPSSTGRASRQAVVLNGATEIALTFADYVDVKNRQATRYVELSPETQAMIEKLERVGGVPVRLVSVNFQKGVLDGVIDISQRT